MKDRNHSQSATLTWFQFRLSTLVFAVPIFCAILYWGANAYQDHVSRAAEAELVRTGVTITSDERGHRVVFDGRNANTVSEEVWILLKKIKDLKGVDFSYGFPITDTMASHLSELTSLNRLSFSGSRRDPGITNAGLAHLASLTSLESLALNRMAITDDGLQYLSGLTSLRELSLANTNITESGIAQLQGLPRLQTLNLLGARISNEGFKQIAKLQTLEELSVRINDGDGLRHLRPLKQLRTLNSNGYADDAALIHLNQIPWLEELYLVGTQVTDAGMQHVGRLVGLRKLDLARTHVTDDGLKHLIGLKRLEFLGLFKSYARFQVLFTDVGCIHLAQLRNLRELILTNSNVSDDGIKQLADHCKLLEMLCVRGSNVGDAGMKQLAALPNLRRLDVEHTFVGNEGLKCLQKLNSLEELSVGGSFLRDGQQIGVFSENARKEFERALPYCEASWWSSMCRHTEYGDY